MEITALRIVSMEESSNTCSCVMFSMVELFALTTKPWKTPGCNVPGSVQIFKNCSIHIHDIF